MLGSFKRRHFLVSIFLFILLEVFYCLDQITTARISLNGNDRTVSQLFLNDFYVITNTHVGKLNIWDVSSSSLKYSLFKNSVFQNQDKCVKFDIQKQNYQTIVTLTDNQQLISATLMSNGTISKIDNQSAYNGYVRQDVEIAAGYVLSLQTNSSANYTPNIIRIFDTSFNTIRNITSNFSYMIYNIEACSGSSLSGSFYFALWKTNCYIEIFKCTSTLICSSVFNYTSSYCTTGQLNVLIESKYKVKFSTNCSKLIFNQKNIGARVLDVNTGVFQNQFSIYTQTFTDFAFLTDNHYYVGGIKINGDYKIFQNVNESSRYQLNGNISNFGQYSEYNTKNKIFVEVSNTAIYFYSWNCTNYFTNLTCFICPSNCLECYISGVCTICQAGYSINNNNICVISSTNSNSYNNSNSSVYNNSVSSIQSSVPVKPIYNYEQKIGQVATNTFDYWIGTSTTYIVSFLQFFPFTFLFLRFINFWSICSMYLFINVQIPTYLNDILYQIYQNINTSLFAKFSFNPYLQLKLQQKFSSEKSQKYGLSSDIINSNIQSFSIMAFSYLILGLLYLIKTGLSPKNMISKQLTFLGQYVAVMNVFYLNIAIIKDSSTQEAFTQKLNLCIVYLFFIFSSVTPALAIIFLDTKIKDIRQKQQNQCQNKAWIIDCLSNVLVPITAMLGNLGLFFTVNTLFFLYTIYAAKQQVQFRINRVVLSLYINLFNFGFIIMTFFNEKDYPQIYHNVGLGTTIIIFLGAIHELITLLSGVIYDFICWIKKKCQNKVNNTPSKRYALKNLTKIQQKKKKYLQKDKKLNELLDTKSTIKYTNNIPLKLKINLKLKTDPNKLKVNKSKPNIGLIRKNILAKRTYIQKQNKTKSPIVFTYYNPRQQALSED